MVSMQAKHKHAYLYALAAVLFWATDASAFKLTLGYLPVTALLLYAAITSTAVFFLCLAATGKLPSLKMLTRQDYFRSAVLGFLNPFLYYIVIFKAYNLLPAQQAMTINWVWPIMLVLLSILLLGQKIKPISLLAVFISFAGVFFIATAGKPPELKLSNPVGVFLALASTLIWAIFWIYNVRDNLNETVRLFLNFLFGTAYILLAAVISGTLQAPPIRGLLGAIYIGLFEMGITYLVWLKALRAARTTAQVANLVYLVPFLSLIIISLIVGEKILFSTGVGLILIIAGIAMQRIFG
jgi:drug/metabolite transporter (DMT)-like permease